MPDLVKTLAARASSIGALTRGVSAADQVSRGYGHTLQEICRQPEAWQAIASRLPDCIFPSIESSDGVTPRWIRKFSFYWCRIGANPAGQFETTGAGSECRRDTPVS